MYHNLHVSICFLSDNSDNGPNIVSIKSIIWISKHFLSAITSSLMKTHSMAWFSELAFPSNEVFAVIRKYLLR